MFNHHVGWVLGGENLTQLKLSGILFLLDLDAANVDFAMASAAEESA